MYEALIIGGGIGGLTLAIALQQRGIRAAVYEAAPLMRPVGAGILLPPNAMRIFRQLGLADRLRDAGVVPAATEIRDARAGVLQRIDTRLFAERYGEPMVAIHRGRLHAILADALDPAQLHLGKRCSTIHDDSDGIRVRFSDESEAYGNILIGADGLRSIVRRQLFPDAALRYSGQSSFRAIAPVSLPDDLRQTGWEVWGAGCRFGFTAIAPNQVYWYATMDATEKTLRADESGLAQLHQLFAGFPPTVGDLIAATPAEAIIATDIHDLQPLATWHRGRIGLLGDAAHATTPNLGQGGAQAVEDAAVLAACLAANPSDPQQAFGRYEAQRYAQATMVVERSRSMGRMAHMRNPLARTLRNGLVRLIPYSITERQYDVLFSDRRTPT